MSAITQHDLPAVPRSLGADPYRVAVDLAAIFSETDLQGNITYVNEQFCAVSGYTPAELVGKNHRIIKSGEHAPEFFQQMWHTISSGQVWRGEVCNRCKNGDLYWVSSTIVPLLDEGGLPYKYVSIRFDISEQRKLLHAAMWQAKHDTLTGLPNRTLLTDRFAQAVANTRRTGRLMAVCLLDLDGFKAINDTLGHATGDALLVVVAQRLQALVRPLDTAVRLGGDEFVLLLAELGHADEARAALARVMSELAMPCDLGAHQVEVTASIGVAMYAGDDSTVDTLLRRADQALYVAKQAGRHGVRFFDVQHDRSAVAHYQTLARVGNALKSGHMSLHYQPKYNLRTCKVVGLEALLRWQHPTEGMIPPLAFLPLVEKTDLIADIGDWVLTEALRQLASWASAGQVWPVSVNIAARHFQRPDFVDRLQHMLAQQPTVEPAWLEIEILESVALDHVQDVRETILKCQAMGVTFALDDFGTGYSSLSYLKRLPANTLKIDRAFVRDILEDKDDLALTEAIISLATVFDRHVVAEGVENAEQGVLLMRLGCDVGQGFGIARPMPAAELPAWVASYLPDPAWEAWADSKWALADFPLLVAQQDHLQWVRRIITLVDGGGLGLTQVQLCDHRQCRFGQWYSGPGKQLYGEMAAYHAVDVVHRRVHKLGLDMCRLYAAGQRDQALGLRPELLLCSDNLLALLNSLQAVVLSPQMPMRNGPLSLHSNK